MDRLARPPIAALEWAGEVVGSPIRTVTPLAGGMSTGIHLLEAHNGEVIDCPLAAAGQPDAFVARARASS